MLAELSGTAHLVQIFCSIVTRACLGGYGTKTHLKTDFDGLPIAFDLIGREAVVRISRHTWTSGRMSGPASSSPTRATTVPETDNPPGTPHRKTTKNRPKRFARALYREGARIEQVIGKLKRLECIALWCERAATNFSFIVALAAAFILIKSAHKT